MKTLTGLLLTAAVACAAEFHNGQAARVVIGQQNFSANLAAAGPASFLGIHGISWANGKLIAADASGNRVLLYDTAKIPAPKDDLTPLQWLARPLCGFTASTVIGQPDFLAASARTAQTGLQFPSAVSTDGNLLAVADTRNHRVLLWRSLPSVNNPGADVVLGQPDFTASSAPVRPAANTLLNPSGVWVQGNRLFVADTGEKRVLIWSNVGSLQSGQPADLVLGQPGFTSIPAAPVSAASLAAPSSVTSDGTRLIVTDPAASRVLLWNSIPTSNGQPADLVLGQPDFASSGANNTAGFCSATGTDANAKPTYPERCEKTLNAPASALSDGKRLFIADSGNHRVLVFNTAPVANGAPADAVLGQPDFTTDQIAAIRPDTLHNPSSLALDGANLYVGDTADNRILVFTPGDSELAATGVLNAASLSAYAQALLSFSGAPQENDVLTLTIAGREHRVRARKGDTAALLAARLVSYINAGSPRNPPDPSVMALLGGTKTVIELQSRQPGPLNDPVPVSVSVSATGQLTARLSSDHLTGGSGQVLSPGSLAVILGTDLSDTPAASREDGVQPLPVKLGGVEVQFDGIALPLLSVSSSQIRAQIPYRIDDSVPGSVYVRTEHADGTVSVTNATTVPIAPASPGLFAFGGLDPRQGLVLHANDNAVAVVSLEGTGRAGSTVTIQVGERSYMYATADGESADAVRDKFIDVINHASDPLVTATAGTAGTRLVLTARIPGIDGNGIPVSASTSAPGGISCLTHSPVTCCASQAGSPVTRDNPARPGEVLTLWATGLGRIDSPTPPVAGVPFNGSRINTLVNPVVATVEGRNAEVIAANLPPGSIGVYELQILLPGALPAEPDAQIYVAQGGYLSNTVTIPIAGGTQ